VRLTVRSSRNQTISCFVRWSLSKQERRWSEPVPGREFHPLKSSAFHGAGRVENRGAVTLASRWIVDSAFASSPQSGWAWFCFLFPLIEPDRRISRIRLSEKTHAVPCDAACNF
jgi:hypothetical protein